MSTKQSSIYVATAWSDVIDQILAYEVNLWQLIAFLCFLDKVKDAGQICTWNISTKRAETQCANLHLLDPSNSSRVN